MVKINDEIKTVTPVKFAVFISYPNPKSQAKCLIPFSK